MSQLNLFELASVPSPKLPPGLTYAPDAISLEEEQALLAQLAALPFTPVMFKDYEARRREVAFGWSYDFSRNQLVAAAPLPKFLMPLRDRAAALAGREAANFEQALILEYPPGASMGWHRDKAEFEDIVGFSLLSACPFRLRRADAGGWARARFIAEPRSAYHLSGPARNLWEHAIAPVAALRFSVTFRTFRPRRNL